MLRNIIFILFIIGLSAVGYFYFFDNQKTSFKDMSEQELLKEGVENKLESDNPRFSSEPENSVVPPKKNDGIYLPEAHVGVSYSTPLTFDSSKDPQGPDTLNPYVLDALPPGLSLDQPMYMSSHDESASEATLSSITISGTPSQSGEYQFIVQYNEDPFYSETYHLLVK